MKRTASILLCTSLLASGSLGMQTTASATTPKAPKSIEVKGEVSPAALFVPDRCIYALGVTKAGNGWYVRVGGGKQYFLDVAARESLWGTPKVGDSIDVMFANNSDTIIVGWKIL